MFSYMYKRFHLFPNNNLTFSTRLKLFWIRLKSASSLWTVYVYSKYQNVLTIYGSYYDFIVAKITCGQISIFKEVMFGIKSGFVRKFLSIRTLNISYFKIPPNEKIWFFDLVGHTLCLSAVKTVLQLYFAWINYSYKNSIFTFYV